MATNTQEVIAKVFLDNSDALAKIEQLNKTIADFEKKKLEAFRAGDTKGAAAITKEINKAKRELAAMETTAQKVNKTLGSLSTAGVKDLERTIRAINAELSSGRIKRGSDEWNVLQSSLKKCKAELAGIKAESVAAGGNLSKVADFFNRNWGFFTQALGTITTLSLTIRQTTKAFLDWDTAMANVRKYTGQTSEEVEAMNEKFRQMDTRTPVNQLNELAGAAGRLGIKGEKDIMEFVDAADKINVALGDDLGQGAVDQIGKLAMAFGEDDRLGLRGAMLATGSAINELAQSSAANAGYLVDFGARIAAVGNQVGLTQAQIFGLGAVLDENMQKDEMAATAVSQLLVKMTTDTATFAKLAGKPVAEFSKMVKEDFNGALTALFQNLNKVEDMESLAHMFEDMGLDGTRCVTVLSTMAGKIDDITRLQKKATEAYEQGTSVIEEYNVQNNTLQADVDKAKKKFLELSTALGKDLLPVVKYTVGAGSLMVKALSTTINFIKEHIVGIISAASAVAAYTVVVKANTIAVKAATVASTAWNAVTKVGTFLWGTAKTALLMLKAAWIAVEQSSLRAHKAQLAMNAAMRANPLGLLATAIGVVVYMLGKLITRAEKVTEVTKGLEKAMKSADAEYAEQKLKIDRLIETAKRETVSLEERKKAVDELNRIIPGYNAQINETTGEYTASYEALKKYNDELLRNAKVKGAQSVLEENTTEQARLMAVQMEARRHANRYAKDPEAFDLKEFLANADRETMLQFHSNRNLAFKAQGITTKSFVDTQTDKTTVVYIDEATGRQITEGQLDAIDRRAAIDAEVKRLAGVVKEQQGRIDEIEEENKDLAQMIEDNGGSAVTAGNDGNNGGSGSDGGGGNGSGYKSQKQLDEEKKRHREQQKEADSKERASLEMHLVELTILYSKGEKDYFAYQDEMYEAQKDSLLKRQALWDEDSKEYADIARQLQDLEDKRKAGFDAEDAKSLEREHQTKMALIKASLDEQGNYTLQSEEAINEALYQENVRYLKAKRDLYMKGTKEWYELEAQLCDAQEREQLRKQTAYQKQLKRMREQYGMMDVEKQRDIALKGLDKLHRQGLVSEEEYQKLRFAIIAEYTRKANDTVTKETDRNVQNLLDIVRSRLSERDRTLGDTDMTGAGIGGQLFGIALTIKNYRTMFAEIQKMKQENLLNEETATRAEAELRQQLAQDIVSYMQAAYSSINSLASAASKYAKACSDYELAKVTANYDRMIAAAGNNEKKKLQLEKEKDAQVRAIKTKANKRAMYMEIAQAIAATSLASINAYASSAKIPYIGHIVAPIAAGAALTAGMIEVAAIKKQHDAQAAGYYKGGFTGGRRYRREAGVVHEGEFVANHNAVGNPNLLPVLELIDAAQRNNTVSRLTMDDVRSVSGGQAVVAPIVNVTADNSALRSAIDGMNEAVQRLNAELAAGIKAPIYLDGPCGLMRNIERYNSFLTDI